MPSRSQVVPANSKTFLKRLLLVGLFAVMLIQLTGCSTVVPSKQDGPPSYQVDASKIPNAVPKTEARSRYGNPNSYVVSGKRYYVMKSAQGYSQVGYASWYGMKFHNRLTSSREPYDLLGMTAASKTLPLPTYVQVTNLRNNRTIIVKVNDRGPFKSDRIIDLSYAAAKKLGFASRGTALVRVTAINPKTWSPEQEPRQTPTVAPPSTQAVFAENRKIFTPEKNPKSAFYMQVGVFKNPSNAKKLSLQLTELTHVQTQIKKSHLGQHPVYRVQIGPILSHTASTKIRAQLSDRGFHNPIVLMNS